MIYLELVSGKKLEIPYTSIVTHDGDAGMLDISCCGGDIGILEIRDLKWYIHLYGSFFEDNVPKVYEIKEMAIND